MTSMQNENVKKKSIHVSKKLFRWNILDIQKKKISKYGKDKKNDQWTSVPMTAWVLKDKMKYLKYAAVTLNYSDSMSQPVWKTRPFPVIKEP